MNQMRGAYCALLLLKHLFDLCDAARNEAHARASLDVGANWRETLRDTTCGARLQLNAIVLRWEPTVFLRSYRPVRPRIKLTACRL